MDHFEVIERGRSTLASNVIIKIYYRYHFSHGRSNQYKTACYLFYVTFVPTLVQLVKYR